MWRLNRRGYTVQHIDEIQEALDGSGNLLGYVFTVTTSEGYGGDLTFTLGVKEDGTLNGIHFLSISETAGLGMKAKEAEFSGSVQGKKTGTVSNTKRGLSSDSARLMPYSRRRWIMYQCGKPTESMHVAGGVPS